MDDWVEIGVFAPTDRSDGLSDALSTPLYLQKHRITSAAQTITVIVPHRPARAGIDPHDLLIEWDLDDDVQAVRVQD